MSTVSLTKPEILARLLEIHTARLAFDREEADLWARLQQPKGNTKRPIELTFGKNTIAWGNGQVLYIKGKGYKFIRALYYANGMRLKRDRLGRLVWDNDCVRQNTFIVFLHRLSEKLEMARFPYRLRPVKSKEQVQDTGKIRNGKPDKVRMQSEIMGAKLCITINCKNVMSD